MKNNNNTVQKQINRVGYENHMHRQLLRVENNITQILDDYIKTSDLGLVTLALINNHDLKESHNERGWWLIKKNMKSEDLYINYKNKKALVDPLIYSKTLINLITKDIKNYA